MLNEHRQYELLVRPLGRNAADEYYHNGAVWIEGREGNSYTIELKNNTSTRTMFIVSVDGLDVLEGKTAGPASKGYVVNAYQNLVIPGWKLNDKEAAEFFFSRKSDSYVNSIGGSTTNTGVIGAMAFREYVAPPPPPVHWSGIVAKSPYDYPRYYGGAETASLSAGNARGIAPNSDRTLIGASLRGPSISTHIVDQSFSSAAIPQNSVNTMHTSSPVTQEIGTGFGDATQWQTFNTTFRKANPDSPDAVLALYYNTARNLEKMGIRLRKKRDVDYRANPFPGYTPGCKPPPGWTP